MPEVHKIKEVSSIERRPFRPNVTTEFEWEVRSVHERFASGRDFFTSGSFDLRGTEHTNEILNIEECARTYLHVKHKDRGYEISLSEMEYYVVSVVATLCCADQKQSVTARSNSSDAFGARILLFSMAHSTPMASAIKQYDSFTVNLKITTISAMGITVETKLESGKTSSDCPLLADQLHQAFKSGDLTDIVLKSDDGDSFPAHRQILALRSPVLRAMFYGHMQEAQSGTASVKASSAGLAQLLRCIYTDDIDKDLVDGVASELIELGTLYEVPRLTSLVKDWMVHTLSIDNAADRLCLAMRFSLDDLKTACVHIVKRNLGAVMDTKGWMQIANDKDAMGMLMTNEKKRPSEADISPKKLKRLQR
mmetsp:Transcript_17974/g.35145  ORF Transcript_17974/g.35145 Transcript_17974/m.35145 type:complete len:365 (-) Transcript_17974:129-1223(-)|eukprot:CAMPEP_0172698732 /NCGR_PEP_ID=MMETSP1074-20121228/29677_1 /TAXON_ID=2916 /ORGANISM="Ceratium fusus, Strain PA161109" /LENGTH=364 /DNA_ID=CAMNT_0013519817 /DNA_START=63 /DNA_END=1157 /DNA_ORIENTATION=-